MSNVTLLNETLVINRLYYCTIFRCSVLFGRLTLHPFCPVGWLYSGVKPARIDPYFSPLFIILFFLICWVGKEKRKRRRQILVFTFDQKMHKDQNWFNSIQTTTIPSYVLILNRSGCRVWLFPGTSNIFLIFSHCPYQVSLQWLKALTWILLPGWPSYSQLPTARDGLRSLPAWQKVPQNRNKSPD